MFAYNKSKILTHIVAIILLIKRRHVPSGNECMLYVKRLFFIDMKSNEIHGLLNNLVDMRTDDVNRLINIISHSVPFNNELIHLILKSSPEYGVGKFGRSIFY